MKNLPILSLMALLSIGDLGAQSAGKEIPLYPGAVPNARQAPDPEQTEVRPNGERFISATAVPTLTIFQPKQPNGKAVIVCPGGGYRGVSIDKEGFKVAQELNKDSITVFVLKYRAPNDVTNIDKSLAPLQDAQQAIRYVRQHAKEYHIDPSQVGIMGFSAGGHLAASAATRYQKPADPNEPDTTSLRPDFAILIYPVISFTEALAHKGSRTNLLGAQPREADILLCSAEKQATKDTPPVFLVHAADDQTVPVGNSLAFYSACIDHGVSAEMHLYPKGGHGFGMFNPTTSDRWIERLKNWLKDM